MKRRKRLIKAELVSSPDPRIQAQCREKHELELKGHTFNNPRTKTRVKGSWLINNPRSYEASRSVGRDTLC